MNRIAATLVMLSVVIVSCTDDNQPTVPAATIESSTGNPINTGSQNPYTLAVIGDMPYGPAKFAELPSLIALINSDPKVDGVVHLGDIKAGSSSPCTDEYFASVKTIFDELKDPFIYTPGDNEWTDCHVASKNNGLYTPTERLQAIRTLFFPVPGQSLGGRKKQLVTQADDPANSAYVENVLWMESEVVFALLNITGSNNDLTSWGTPLPADAGNYPSQAAERASRAQANTAWLNKAFALATSQNAAGVVLGFQADMWDPTASLSGFDALVVQIGNLAIAFGKPVLLLMGDSHVFLTDRPYTTTSPFFALHAGTPIAPNVSRVVVEGSAAGRTEYTRLTIDPSHAASGLFKIERVPLQ